jgi:nitric oxide reductase subunit C
MSNKGIRNLFIFGSIFFFAIFVVLTVDTMKKIDKRAPKITEEVDAGKKLWHKYDCIGCHTILGNGSYYAPDLTKITVNKPEGYLEKFLVNPRKVKPTAAMPVLGIKPDEAKKLVAFLDWVSKVDTNGWPPKPVLAKYSMPQIPGVTVYEKYNCKACHMISGVGGTSGPDLTHVASRKPDPEWHKKHIRDPQSVVPDSAMPPYPQISDEELNQLIDYLITLK